MSPVLGVPRWCLSEHTHLEDGGKATGYTWELLEVESIVHVDTKLHASQWQRWAGCQQRRLHGLVTGVVTGVVNGVLSWCLLVFSICTEQRVHQIQCSKRVALGIVRPLCVP